MVTQKNSNPNIKPNIVLETTEVPIVAVNEKSKGNVGNVNKTPHHCEMVFLRLRFFVSTIGSIFIFIYGFLVSFLYGFFGTINKSR